MDLIVDSCLLTPLQTPPGRGSATASPTSAAALYTDAMRRLVFMGALLSSAACKPPVDPALFEETIQGVGALVRDVDHERLPDAELVAAGSRNLPDASGHLIYDQELPGFFPVVAELAGYARTGSGPPVEVEQLSATLLTLVPTASLAGGASITHGDVSLAIPDGRVVDRLGEPISGPWTLEALVPTGDDRWAVPGESTLRYDDVLDEPIHPFHPIYLQGIDEAGELVNLDENAEVEATLRYTLPAGSPVQTDWRLLLFSMSTQRWVRSDRVVVEGGVVEVPLGRFGWVAFAEEDVPRGCVTGKVFTDDGREANGAEVRLLEDGVAVPTRAWVDDGRFCLAMEAGNSGALEVLWYSSAHDQVGVATQSVRHGGTDASFCGGSCFDIGSIELEVGRDLDGDFFYGGPGGDCDDTDDSVNPSVAYGDGSWCGTF